MNKYTNQNDQFNNHHKSVLNMKNDNKKNSLLKLVKTIFKPKKTDNQPKREPRWMYRNE